MQIYTPSYDLRNKGSQQNAYFGMQTFNQMDNRCEIHNI